MRTDIRFQSIATQLRAYADGLETPGGLCRRYRQAIVEIDESGPGLRSILALDPDHAVQAAAVESTRFGTRSSLAGIPILIKDNILCAGALPTTAGSLALRHWVPGVDAPVVQRLKAAGALVLGKANLSEWANFRSPRSTSGWSSVGGQTRNPHVLDRNPSGSSTGSAVAVSAGLCTAAVGTETDGSITSPASMNGIVGVKPTVGLVSRTGIVPISHRQDTAGPLARSVHDAALLLSAMAGPDPADQATGGIPDGHAFDFDRSLGLTNLEGMRIGMLAMPTWALPQLEPLYRRAENLLRDLRADMATGLDVDSPGWARQEIRALNTEFKTDLNAFLGSQAVPPPVGSLSEIIAFNREHAAEVMPIFGQEQLLAAEESDAADPRYAAAVEELARLAGDGYLLHLLDTHRLDLLIAPTSNPPAVIDQLLGTAGRGSFSSAAAVTGYPHVTVPMGTVSHLPVGLSFVGRPFSERILLQAADCFERALDLDPRPAFIPSLGIV